jgi:hypothetical protein
MTTINIISIVEVSHLGILAFVLLTSAFFRIHFESYMLSNADSRPTFKTQYTTIDTQK